jgi:hypothetical protein
MAAREPETRTMAIALGARPDDSAKMVWSRGCIAYLFPARRKDNALYAAPDPAAYCTAAYFCHGNIPAAIMLQKPKGGFPDNRTA